MSRAFELREHTADVAVEAHGATLGDAFAAVADGMAAAMCDDVPETDAERFTVEVRASTNKRLLFDYLDALIYERDVRGVLPVANEASVAYGDDGADGDEPWALDASAAGVPLSEVAARDLKAVTFSEMRIEERDGAWEAYVVFDV
ncbi:archease [Halarchaeum sp. CBA1220]|uniref:archease n=1 Tax=Halarchaeum sp. CBA1220 TaxID=1853682 RepID=UPI000F3A856C|nr:archease [Halarchaeum sp. CBA1220]QLC32740.1 archease [Halarchaeum sp. CBA1220]